MPPLRSLTTCARPLSRLAAVALAGLALSLALIVGSSPAQAAGRPAAAPSQTAKAPPVISPRTEDALLSQRDRSLSKLGKRPTLRQLRALGLRPVPKQLAARFNKLAHSTGARAADVGAAYWFTYQYYGHFWAIVDYSGPYLNPAGLTYYDVYSNYWICPSQSPGPASVFDGLCMDLDVYTEIQNWDIDGTYYYYSPPGSADAFSPDSAGMPEYGFGPVQG